MAKIKFRFLDDRRRGLGVGYIGWYKNYGFAVHKADEDGLWRVLWSFELSGPIRHEKPFQTAEEAMKCAEDLLKNLLNKN